MHLVEHTLRGRHSIDLVACDSCGRVADAAAAASWLHLGPFTPSPTEDALAGLDFCTLECAAKRVGDAVMAPSAPTA